MEERHMLSIVLLHISKDLTRKHFSILSYHGPVSPDSIVIYYIHSYLILGLAVWPGRSRTLLDGAFRPRCPLLTPNQYVSSYIIIHLSLSIICELISLL